MYFLRLLVLVGLVILGIACDTQNSASPEVTDAPVEENHSRAVDTFDLDGFTANYENTNRLDWQRPNLIIGLLGKGDLSNKVVADIGTGNGFFAKRITPLAKKVIALDIDQTFLSYVDSTSLIELSKEERARLETRLTPPDSPNLFPQEVDAVLIVNTFMYIKNKREYLEKLKPKFKLGGRLVIVDFKRKRTPIGPRPYEHRAPLYVVEDLLYEAGYKNIQAIDTELNYQYILVADL